MTAKKVSELTALTVAASEDLILIVDDPSGEPTSKKITLGNLTKTVTSNLVSSNTLFANTIQANINFFTGSSTNNTAITSTSIRIGNSTSNSIITQNTITIATANITSTVTNTANVVTSISVGSNVVINTSAILVNNGISNTRITGSLGYFGSNVQINGELIVSGLNTHLDTDTVEFSANTFKINSALPSGDLPTADCGMEIERGSQNNVFIIWKESIDKWQISNTTQGYANIAIEPAGPYSNLSSAVANGVNVGQLWYDDNGAVFIRMV